MAATAQDGRSRVIVVILHCHTFPTISITPNGLVPLGCASTSLAGPITLPCSAIGAGASFGSVPRWHSARDGPDVAPEFDDGFSPPPPAPPPPPGGPPLGADCQSQLPHG